MYRRRWRIGDQSVTDQQRLRLVQLAYRFVWSSSDAEDAVQNALVLAEQNRGQLRQAEKQWSWLCRIVVRQSLLLRRGERRHADRVRRLASLEGANSAYDGDTGLQPRRSEWVRAAIEQLPPQQQTAIVLRYLEQMPFERIAEIMELAQSTVRVHVRAGREALRKWILHRERRAAEEMEIRNGAL